MKKILMLITVILVLIVPVFKASSEEIYRTSPPEENDTKAATVLSSADTQNKFLSSTISFVTKRDEMGNIERTIVNNSSMSIMKDEVKLEGSGKVIPGIDFTYGNIPPDKIIVHNRLDWGEIYDPPPSLDLPVGTYDVWGAGWDGIVVIEGIEVTLDYRPNVFVGMEDAIYKMEVFAKDQYGAYINGVPREQAILLRHDTFPIGLLCHYMGYKDFPERWFSAVSDNYTVSWSVKTLFHDDFFSLGSYVDTGINSDILYKNKPKNFRHFKLKFKATPDDFPAGEDYPWIYFQGSTFYKKQSLPPFVENFYIEPQLHEPILNIFEFRTDGNGDGNLIYRTPAIASPDGLNFGLYLDSSLPYYTILSNNINFGLGPDSFNLRFQVEGNNLVPYVANPNAIGTYFTQTGEQRRKNGRLTWYYATHELYKDGNLISSGTLKDFFLTEEILTGPGLYRFIIKNDEFFVRDQEAINEIEFTFDVTGPSVVNDVHPPYFFSLQLLNKGEVTEVMKPCSCSCLKFHLDDDTGISEASVTCFVDGIPQGNLPLLSPTDDSNTYIAHIPPGLLSIDEGYVSIEINATDYQGNSLKYKLDPAFYYDGITHCNEELSLMMQQ